MVLSSLATKLKNAGYKINYGTFRNWDQAPYIEKPNGKKLFLLNAYYRHGTTKMLYSSKTTSFKLVEEAIEADAEYLLDIDLDWKPFLNNKKKTKSWEV